MLFVLVGCGTERVCCLVFFGNLEFDVWCLPQVPRLLLLCLQEFTIIKEDAQLGRLQLYMKGRKLSSTGTLFSEGKGVHRCCHFWVVLICFFFSLFFGRGDPWCIVVFETVG